MTSHPKYPQECRHLPFGDKGNKELCDADEIIKLCCKITTFLKREHNITGNGTGSGGYNDRTNSNSGNNSSNFHSSSAPCRKHNGAHLWKDGPTTGAIQTAAMPMKEIQAKPPIPIPTSTLALKTPVQGKDLRRSEKQGKPANHRRFSNGPL